MRAGSDPAPADALLRRPAVLIAVWPNANYTFLYKSHRDIDRVGMASCAEKFKLTVLVGVAFCHFCHRMEAQAQSATKRPGSGAALSRLCFFGLTLATCRCTSSRKQHLQDPCERHEFWNAGLPAAPRLFGYEDLVVGKKSG